MTTRYTNKALRYDINYLNSRLSEAGSLWYLEAGSRNGYSAVDVLSIAQYEYRQGNKNGNSGACRVLQTGTPKECYAAAETFYYQQLLAIKGD